MKMDLANIINNLNLEYKIPTDRQGFINWCKYTCPIEDLVTSILNNMHIPLDIRIIIVRYLTHNKSKRAVSIPEEMMSIITTLRRDIEMENSLFLKQKNRQRKNERAEMNMRIKRRRLDICTRHIDFNSGDNIFITQYGVLSFDLMRLIVEYLDLITMRHMRLICKYWYKMYMVVNYPIVIPRDIIYPSTLGMHLASYTIELMPNNWSMKDLCHELQYNICLCRDKAPNNSRRIYMNKAWTLFDRLASHYVDRLIIPCLSRIPSYPLEKGMNIRCVEIYHMGHLSAFIQHEYDIFQPAALIIHSSDELSSWSLYRDQSPYSYVITLILCNDNRRKPILIDEPMLRTYFPNLTTVYMVRVNKKLPILETLREHYMCIHRESLDDVKF